MRPAIATRVGDTETIILIHGLWETPRAWEAFRALYERCGHRVLAPPWPRLGEEVETIRADPSPLAGLGIAEIVDHYDGYVRALKRRPILMGHSLGGLVVQMLLDRGLGAAGVAIAPAPPKGVLRIPLSTIRSLSAVLLHPASYRGVVVLSFEQYRYAFANTMDERDARAAYERLAIPAPGRPVIQTALANVNLNSTTFVDYENGARAPLLLIVGSSDHLLPPSLVRANYKRQAVSAAVTDIQEFPGRDHLIITEPGWEEVADETLAWALVKAAQARGQRPAPAPIPHQP